MPDNPGAWLMATAKHRAIDQLRREQAARAQARGDRARARRAAATMAAADRRRALDDDVGDDLLRLVFIACHPVLSTEARVALTLRLLGGLTTDEIARAFLVPEPTIAQRIVRAKKTLAEANVPFEVPRGAELRRAALVGARGDLSRLQRGLLGDGGRRLDASRAVRGRAAARPHPRRARAGRARGARPRRADGDPGVARARARRRRRASRFCCSTRIARAGISCSSAAASRRSSAPSSSAARSGRTRCRRRSPRVTRGRARPRRRTGQRIAALYDDARGAHAVAGGRAESRGRGRHGVRPRGGPRARRPADVASRRSRRITCCRACAATCSRSSARCDEARAEFERAAALTRNVREKRLLLERAAACATPVSS